MVSFHHERVDGNGYPEGLEGSAIPLWARLNAVADTYYALTSDRPYRAGMEHDQALTVVKNAAGSQLCPECVRLFLEWSMETAAEKVRRVEQPGRSLCQTYRFPRNPVVQSLDNRYILHIAFNLLPTDKSWTSL